jgi:hypothetical protein
MIDHHPSFGKKSGTILKLERATESETQSVNPKQFSLTKSDSTTACFSAPFALMFPPTCDTIGYDEGPLGVIINVVKLTALSYWCTQIMTATAESHLLPAYKAGSLLICNLAFLNPPSF